MNLTDYSHLPATLLGGVLAVLPPLVAPDHSDGLTFPPVLARVPALLVIKLGLAAPRDGGVGLCQLLVRRLRSCPLVTGKISTWRK